MIPAFLQPRNHLVKLLLMGSLAIASCGPTTLAPTASAIETAPTPTATIEFPTLAPTPTEGRTLPTAEVASPLIDAGEIIYHTEFEDAGQWPLGQDSFGAVSLGAEALAVVLPRPNLVRLITSPAPVQENFILDVTLSAEVCQATDEFGLAFWLNPEGDHMQFTITCQGGVRLRRVLGDERRAWAPFIEREPAVLAGAPAQNRLTVRSLGDTFRLYVNGFQVLNGREQSLSIGGTGLIVRSSPDTSQTTVLFDSFTLYQLEAPLTPEPTGSESADG